MNQLSWLLYLGNVAGNLGPLAVFMGVVLLVASVVFFCLYYAHRENYISSVRYLNRCDTVTIPKFPAKNVGGPLCMGLSVLCWTIATFCPSSDTVYAIAASQIGEQAMKTPVAIKAGQAIESWLDKQISTNSKTSSTTDK